MTSQSPSDRKALEDRIEAVAAEKSPHWPTIGRLILDLEAAGYPALHSGSGHWLEALARRLNLRRASAWRFRAVVRDLLWLRDQLASEDISLPPLESMPAADLPNAEAMEILIRLVRTTTPDIWRTPAQAVIERAMSLRALRQLWSMHRPILAGRTARKHGSRGFIKSVSVDHSSAETQRALMVATQCQALERHFPAVLGRQTGRRVVRGEFLVLTPPTSLAPQKRGAVRSDTATGLTAVAMLVHAEDPKARIHGFLVDPDANQGDQTGRIMAEAALVDHLWLVGPFATPRAFNIGQLAVDAERIDMIACPESVHTDLSGVEDDRLLRWLLARCARPVGGADQAPHSTNQGHDGPGGVQ